MFSTKTLSALAATVFATTALCQSALADSGDYFSLHLGEYNALRSDQTAFLFGGEYRFSEWRYGYGIHPIVGAFGTSKGAAYGYAGFNWNIPILTNQLILVPNFAAGAYSNGDGKDLGGTIEFRSGIEIDYQFDNGHQLGVALNHLSNAGIYSHNPGEENVIVTYSVPVSAIGNALR